METPFINDMFAIFYKAFKNICSKKVDVQWVTEIDPVDGEEVSGITRFFDDGAIEIHILTKQSVTEAVETLIHEFAHVIVGPIKEHGEEFVKARDALLEEYARLLDEDFSDCTTLELNSRDGI